MINSARMRSLLHNCVKDGFEPQVKRAKKDNVFHLHNWIRGKLAYFTMVAPAKAAHLKAIYDLATKRHSGAHDHDPELEMVAE